MATALKISPRHLRRYPVGETKLPREKAIAIAFLLKLSLEETDELFEAANVPLLNNVNRDSIIRDCLFGQMDLEEANKILNEKGFSSIGAKPTKKLKKL